MGWLRVQWDGCRELAGAVVQAFVLRPHRYHHDGWPDRFHLFRKVTR